MGSLGQILIKEIGGNMGDQEALTNEIEKVINQFLKELTGVKVSNVDGNRHLSDFGLDSLDMEELAMFVEEKFSIEITDTELDLLITYGNLVDLVNKKLA